MPRLPHQRNWGQMLPQIGGLSLIDNETKAEHFSSYWRYWHRDDW